MVALFFWDQKCLIRLWFLLCCCLKFADWFMRLSSWALLCINCDCSRLHHIRMDFQVFHATFFLTSPCLIRPFSHNFIKVNNSTSIILMFLIFFFICPWFPFPSLLCTSPPPPPLLHPLTLPTILEAIFFFHLHLAFSALLCPTPGESTSFQTLPYFSNTGCSLESSVIPHTLCCLPPMRACSQSYIYAHISRCIKTDRTSGFVSWYLSFFSFLSFLLSFTLPFLSKVNYL